MNNTKQLSKYRFCAAPENFSDNLVELSTDESHHAIHVLRLSKGDLVRVFDGLGNEFEAHVYTIEQQKVTLTLGKKLTHITESQLDLTLAVALLKHDSFELVIQKAVELGVTKLIPLITSFTEIGPIKQYNQARITRWNRIVIEATKQSKRQHIMQILEKQTFSQVFNQSNNLKIMFAENATNSWEKLKNINLTTPKILILIGPEGGWDTNELTTASEKDCMQIKIGPRILRAETAAIAATSLIQNLFGDLF